MNKGDPSGSSTLVGYRNRSSDRFPAAVKQLLKSAMREICTLRSVGAGDGDRPGDSVPRPTLADHNRRAMQLVVAACGEAFKEELSGWKMQVEKSVYPPSPSPLSPSPPDEKTIIMSTPDPPPVRGGIRCGFPYLEF